MPELGAENKSALFQDFLIFLSAIFRAQVESAQSFLA